MNTEKYVFSKTRILVGSVFLVILLLISALLSTYLINWVKFKQNAAEVDAVIVNILFSTNSGTTDSHNVKISYTYNNTTYETFYPNYSSSMYVGKHLSVFVNKDNPDEIKPTSCTVVLIVDIVFLFFVFLSGKLLFGELLMGFYINRLIAEDYYIYADFERRKITSLVVNENRYFSTVFKYTDETGMVRYFESKPYPLDKCPYEEGKGARVYVNLDANPRKYYVSLHEHERYDTEY